MTATEAMTADSQQAGHRPGPRRRWQGRTWIYTALGIFFLAVMLFPVYWIVNISLQPGGSTLPSAVFPAQPSWNGYLTAIQDQGGHLATSLIVSLGTVVVTLAIAAPCAYALAQFRFRWVSWALLAILITQMVPGIVIANGLYALYQQLGLLDSIPGLIIANAANAIPFGILILYTFMLGVPSAVIDAARVDGAGRFRTFFYIVVPISSNSLITVGLFSFLFAWSDFVFALTLTTKGTVIPITLGIYSYLGTHVTSWSAVMATAVLASIPAIVLLIIAQKYIVAGATAGALK